MDADWQAALAALPAPLRDALVGNRTGDRSLVQAETRKALRDLDARIDPLLAAILRHPALLALEGRWRGLALLCAAAGPGVTVKLAQAPKDALRRDLARAPDLEDSWLWRELHGALHPRVAEPFALLISDDAWGIAQADLNLLQELTAVCAAALCPLVTAAEPVALELESWAELPALRGLLRRAEGPRNAAWRSFRDSEEARFLVLALPRLLARAAGEAPAAWMNPGLALGALVAARQAAEGWCAALGGDADGVVPGLAAQDGGSAEAAVEDAKPAELASLGFTAALPVPGRPGAVCFRDPRTAQKPKSYARPEPTSDAELSVRLGAVLATTRIGQALKIIAEAGLGHAPAARVEAALAGWLAQLVGPEATHPLREGKVELRPLPGQRGLLGLSLALRPWLPGRELHAPLRLTLPVAVG